jgi:recombination associated protein RdgC
MVGLFTETIDSCAAGNGLVGLNVGGFRQLMTNVVQLGDDGKGCGTRMMLISQANLKNNNNKLTVWREFEISRFIWFDRSNLGGLQRVRAMECSMIFKNLSVYRVPSTVDPVALETHLEKRPFKPCVSGQESSMGFARIFGTNSRVFSCGGFHLVCLKSEERKVPPAVVKTKLKKVIEAEERALGRRVNRDERRDLDTQVRADLLRSAEDFVQGHDTWAYLDSQAHLLVINTTSAKTANSVAELLKGGFSDKLLFPLNPSRDVCAQMTTWLKDKQTPEPFSAGVKCDLTDDTGTLKYNKLNLDDPRLVNYLAEGMRVTCLALAMGERCTFTLAEDFTLKSWVLSATSLTDVDHGTGEPLEELAGDLIFMGTEVRELLKGLLAALGGESPEDEVR